jgi:hypothetical protein
VLQRERARDVDRGARFEVEAPVVVHVELLFAWRGQADHGPVAAEADHHGPSGDMLDAVEAEEFLVEAARGREIAAAQRAVGQAQRAVQLEGAHGWRLLGE